MVTMHYISLLVLLISIGLHHSGANRSSGLHNRGSFPDNCYEMRWKEQDPPHAEGCEPYDDSKIPDCHYFLNDAHLNVTSYYHVHEYDCSLFWECGPVGPCLVKCPECGDLPVCDGYNGLSFDCRYQGEFGPVCDWPDKVDCTNNCIDKCCEDDDCPDGQQCVDGECIPNGHCDSDSDCTATDCSSCVDNTCQNPSCCTNDDCPTGYCQPDGTCAGECDEDSDCNATSCSTCNSDYSCVDPECCENGDCEPWQTCEDGTCGPECTEDEQCPEGEFCEDGVCKSGCFLDENCPNKPCSQCVDHQCYDPECCDDSECESGICSEDGTCSEECKVDSDCQATDCSSCDGGSCIDPECCSNEDCEEGLVCDASNSCTGEPGVPGIVKITIHTKICANCVGSGNPLGKVEGGVKVELTGAYETSCISNGLDNLEKVDYDNGKTAFFDGKPDDDDSDDGLGECKLADLNKGLEGGTITWTGDGTWTAWDSQPLCINFFNFDPTCCCELEQKTLATNELSRLIDCKCSI